MWSAGRAGFYSAIKKKEIITSVGKGMELERSALKGSKMHLENISITNITNKHRVLHLNFYIHILMRRERVMLEGEGSKREQWSTRNRKAGSLFGQGWWKKGPAKRRGRTGGQ